jgi:(2R)-3-sulfolactate dehydrogenase (NADP+)
MAGSIRVPVAEARAAAEAALRAHGASPGHAAATGRSVVAAEAEGNRVVGFDHLFDYCAALDAGRADGTAEPAIEFPAAGAVRIDARGGFPHLGVDRAWEEFSGMARRNGVAILALRRGFSSGALGYFARRLAEGQGLVALVAANAGPAVMAASGGRRPVFCTNPIAFAAPLPEGGALVFDQSTAASSLVGIRQAASDGRPIPEGWALDGSGNPTTDPQAALSGTLLAFGGRRGANIALMVELLAAGLTGANWSARAPAFDAGSESPGAGLLILAISPAAAHGAGFLPHIETFLAELSADPTAHVPGVEKGRRADRARESGISVPRDVWDRVLRLAKPEGA